jgi:hypothetical protein
MVTNKVGNQLNRLGHRHRDFHDGYAAFGDRIGSKMSILGRTNTNGRYDPEFFDSLTNFSSLHNWNLSVRLKTLPISTSVLLILYRVRGIHRRKMIVFARKPGIQSWQKEDAYHEVGEKTSNNHDGERALRI